MTDYEAFSLLIILAMSCAIAGVASPHNGNRFIRLLVETFILLCMTAYLLRVWHIFSLPAFFQMFKLPAFADPAEAPVSYLKFATISAALGIIVGCGLAEICSWSAEKLKQLPQWKRNFGFLCCAIVGGLNTVSVFLIYLETNGAVLYLTFNLTLAIMIYFITLFRLCALNCRPSRQ